MFVSVGAPKRDSALHGIIVIIVIVRARLGKEKKKLAGCEQRNNRTAECAHSTSHYFFFYSPVFLAFVRSFFFQY